MADVVPFPLLQHQSIDWLELSHRRHTMHGLIEVDVTDTRRLIREYRARTGATLSLTAFLIYCLGRAVNENRATQACRLGRRNLVIFSDVDVGTMVERDVDGTKIPIPYVIRSANAKTPGEIQRELHAAQVGDMADIATRSLPSRLRGLFERGLPLWLLVPAPLRRLVWTWLLHDPYRRKRIMGTVGVTALSMFGHGTGWVVAPMAHPLALAVGGLSRRSVVVDGQTDEREILCLTLTMDHDLIEGAPAARFARRLVELVERGEGLRERQKTAEAVGAHRSPP